MKGRSTQPTSKPTAPPFKSGIEKEKQPVPRQVTFRIKAPDHYHFEFEKTSVRLSSSDAVTGAGIIALFRSSNKKGVATVEQTYNLRLAFAYNGKQLKLDTQIDENHVHVMVFVLSRPDTSGPRSAVSQAPRITFDKFGPGVHGTTEMHGQAPPEGITLKCKDRLGNTMEHATLKLPPGAMGRNGAPFTMQIVDGPSQVKINGKTYKNVTGK